jgi:3-hydroxyisobutyrate dehydrogenase-like beta-hydroxyacid dehydrogenase
MQVAILGSGLMGTRAAVRFLSGGAQVKVWNRTRHRAEPMARFGAILCDTPAEAAYNADVILAFLADGPAALHILGDAEFAAALSVDCAVYDMGTSTPSVALTLEKILGDCFADAPVSGGTAGVETGTLTVFLGAAARVASRAAADLAPLGRTTLMGPVGSGQAAKLANQIIVAGAIAALAEGLAFGEAVGLDADRLLAALEGGFADSRILRLLGPRMAQRDFAARGKSSTHLKDIACALQTLPAADTLAVTAGAQRYLRAAMAALGDPDHSAMFHAASLALQAEHAKGAS